VPVTRYSGFLEQTEYLVSLKAFAVDCLLFFSGSPSWQYH
jgi:hypothetical protein